ncbi:YidH family protein [Phytohalomonas tamaricis]|uniref:YidH family protein n=1 Tax=Phytohalomonas tamaricis TaxID=2081032 RepID=UPI002948BA2E|nr:DUF202 domain-containing protein [Phytohalomonas tamaricis]
MKDEKSNSYQPYDRRRMLRLPTWQREGKAPDYRFSLANERTFLAWIRTALAFLAGAVGIDQFAPDLAPPPVRDGVAVLLALGGAALALAAYRRWANNEQAMRGERELPHTSMLIMISIGVALIALALSLLVIF